MTAEHTFAALRAHERTTAHLMADHDITGDLLLIGIWLSRAVHMRTPAPTSTSGGGWQLTDIADDLWRVVDAIKRDIRRYDVWADQPGGKRVSAPCGGPMIRREVCGKPARTWSFITDPATGRRRILGACSRHDGWYWEQRRASRAALEGVDVPRPPANAGGCLARYINIDWAALWLGLDPEWTAPPELDSWVRPAPRAPRPRFGVIDGAMATESEPVLT
jgi:hypothetical protein